MLPSPLADDGKLYTTVRSGKRLLKGAVKPRPRPRPTPAAKPTPSPNPYPVQKWVRVCAGDCRAMLHRLPCCLAVLNLSCPAITRWKSPRTTGVAARSCASRRRPSFRPSPQRMVRVRPRQVCPVSNAHPDYPHPIPSPSSVSFAGMVYQVDGDYGARAGAAPGSVLPSKVNNIPAGAVVKDLIGGEAFAMAVLSTGIVYVRLRTRNILLFSPMHVSIALLPTSCPPSFPRTRGYPHRTSSRLRVKGTRMP